MSYTASDQRVAVVLSTALDWIKSHLSDPRGWRLAVYLGREEDPANAYLIGNAEPDQLHAAIGFLMLDSSRLGTVDRETGIKPDPESGAVNARLRRAWPTQIDRPRTAAELTAIIRDWLDADDATHFGDFEKALAAAIGDA
jgi:hypothetical protein